MKKTDIHLHLTFKQHPKTEHMFVSSAEHMLPHLRELSIEKGILMSSGEGNSAVPFGSNDECRQIAEAFPGIYFWMCNLDDVPENIFERLETYKNQGAVGIGELMINRSIDDPMIQEIFAAAETLSLPILFHMSPEVGYEYGIVDNAGLPLLEESLKKYPNLKFIGHSQPFWHEISGDASGDLSSRMEWGKGEVAPGGRLSYLFDTYPNLYGDLSANSGGFAIMRDETFGLSFLEKYCDRLMFATDMVNVDMEFPLGKWLEEMYQCGKLKEEVYRKIAYQNAESLFGLH